MSLKTIIRKANTKCDIKYVTDAQTTGGKLTKTWSMRYHNVPCRFNAKMTQAEMLYYEKASVFPDFIMYMLYRSGILETDKVVFKGRTFDIKKIDDWDETNTYLKIALQEYKPE